jgi:uncharacterized circularly permuted ATP-grasp superfamily protein
MLFITEPSELKLDLPQQAIYFYCSMISTTFHSKFLLVIRRLEAQYPNLPFMTIDCQQFPSQSIRFAVKSVPTVIFFQNGKEIARSINTCTSELNGILADIYRDEPVINGEANDCQ